MIAHFAFLKEKFFAGWGWVATAWGLCVASWTMALIARIIFGSTVWIRLIWHVGLDGAAIILMLLTILELGHLVLRVITRICSWTVGWGGRHGISKPP